jgi:hypothetical protein
VNFDAPKQTPLMPIMTPTPEERPDSFRWRPTLAVSSFILGTVGIGVGVFAGVKAMDKHRTLEENCDDDGNCEPAFHEEYDSFHKWKNISTVGYAVGIVGVGAGTLLLLLGDDDGEPQTALELHPDGATFTHAF